MRIGNINIFLLLAALIFTFLSSEVRAAKPQKIPCNAGYSVKTAPDVDPRDAEAALRAWAQELSGYYGFHVEAVLYDSVDKLVADFVAKKIDFAAMTSVEYLRAAKTLKVKPELTQYRNGKSFVKYLVLANADVQKKGLAGLKNKKLSILKNSNLDRMFLDTRLMQADLPPAESFFSATREKNKESQVILDVFFGHADICVVTDTAFQTMKEMNPEVGRKLHVMAESPDLIATIGVFRPDWPLEYKHKAIKDLSSNFQSYERGRQIMLIFNVEKITAITDDQLDNVRKLVADYDRLSKKR